MEEAKRRVEDCIRTNSTTLVFSGLDLSTLPDLPNHLQILYCNNNKLTTLPSLPSTLIELHCGTNSLISLPTLPAGLKVLDCYSNQITQLAELPSELQHLACFFNKLSKIPRLPETLKSFSCAWNNLTTLPNLPNSLQTFSCHCNPYLHVSKNIAYMFQNQDVISIPNYPRRVKYLKKIYQSRMRVEKLRFCSQLQDNIDEFRYRPNGSGWKEVKERNKGRFADL